MGILWFDFSSHHQQSRSFSVCPMGFNSVQNTMPSLSSAPSTWFIQATPQLFPILKAKGEANGRKGLCFIFIFSSSNGSDWKLCSSASHAGDIFVISRYKSKLNQFINHATKADDAASSFLAPVEKFLWLCSRLRNYYSIFISEFYKWRWFLLLRLYMSQFALFSKKQESSIKAKAPWMLGNCGSIDS